MTIDLLLTPVFVLGAIANGTIMGIIENPILLLILFGSLLCSRVKV